MRTLGGLLLLILDIWAIIRVLGAREDGIKKLLWIVLILIFPLGGVILWLALDGPGSKGK